MASTKLFKGVLPILLITPVMAHAQEDGGELGNLRELIAAIGNLVDTLLPIVVGLALLFFFWGLAVYILNAGNEEKKAEGKNLMVWGVVALFVMVSVWGIIGFIGEALGIPQGGTIDVPQAPLEGDN